MDEGKKKAKKEYPKICDHCDTPFIARRNHARFCGPTCRVENWRKMHWIKSDKYAQLENRIQELEQKLNASK